jgi:PiT family inorganic phosphate transporter
VIWFFLLSGLFLGWSLGANDAANVFGTAVGSRMVKFRTAAIVASLFVIIGATLEGGGATRTLERLGAVNAIAGSFTVALAAALTVAWMTRLQLPVSTSQAIVGGIVGWNLFTGSPTDPGSLAKIVATWVLCPLLSGIIALGLFLAAIRTLRQRRYHLLELDAWTRWGLVLIGAFGAYSLGANNIANVMGVFVPAAPLPDVQIAFLRLSGTQLLFLLGGIAIAVGIFTYSRRVMLTVGSDLFRLTPMMALVVVFAQSLVLYLFASEGIQGWLLARGLPPIPLVPVSSSQAVVGAVVGISIAKGGRGVDYGVLAKIASGWVSTPIVAALITFVALFFVQNVFEQTVVQ